MLNIKRIFETIADAGQKILEKRSLKKFSKKRDLIELCDDLLSSKGAAFGITSVSYTHLTLPTNLCV